MDKKYIGDPDSPNFLPPSPLIDRQVLSSQLEGELKGFCAAVLGKEQSADHDLAHITRYLANKSPQEKQSTKHDKHSSFTFLPPKPYAPQLASSSLLQSTSKLPSKVETQQNRDGQEGAAAIVFEPLEPANKRISRLKPNTDDEALNTIRSKLDTRPKTSAAACIDYTEPTSPAASNRTTSVPSDRTTYSTPYTSAGITPGHTSKRFSQGVLNAAITSGEPEACETTALPRCYGSATEADPEKASRARAWMAEQLARRRRHSSKLPHDNPARKSLPDFHPLRTQPSYQSSRLESRAGSIRNSIREYIRPGSSSNSIRSYRSTTFSREHSRSRFSALKTKISNGSLRSRASSRGRPGYDDGDEYFIDPTHVDLDRPLPPLPGLDSYKEKPRHIGLMMKSIITPSSVAAAMKRNTKNVVIDDNGIERIMSADEEKQRQEDLARAVMEKMSTGSIGSVPTSPTGVISVYRQGVKVSGDGNRPVTAGSGMGVGAVPLDENEQDHVARVVGKEDVPVPVPIPPNSNSSRRAETDNPRPVSGFVKKLGDKLGWGKKEKEKTKVRVATVI